MASSAVSSVIGSPLRTVSCLGFFSAAVAAGGSIPTEKKVLKERKQARRERGVRHTATRAPAEAGLERWRGDSSITSRLTLGKRKSCSRQKQVSLRKEGQEGCFKDCPVSRFSTGRLGSACKRGRLQLARITR